MFYPVGFSYGTGAKDSNQGTDYFTEACPGPCKAYFIWASYLPLYDLLQKLDYVKREVVTARFFEIPANAIAQMDERS